MSLFSLYVRVVGEALEGNFRMDQYGYTMHWGGLP